MHGFYRAISTTSFPWNINEWQQLTKRLKPVFDPSVLERLNHLLIDILQKEDADTEILRIVQTFIARYTSQGRPPTGYFIVCCVIETEWTVLAQVLIPGPFLNIKNSTEAAAANKAWIALMRTAVTDIELIRDAAKAELEETIKYALQCYTDLLTQVDELDYDPSMDSYAWETMSESLVCFPRFLMIEANGILEISIGLLHSDG